MTKLVIFPCVPCESTTKFWGTDDAVPGKYDKDRDYQSAVK